MQILAQEWLDDPHAECNGRQGQAQCGVDVSGYRNGKQHVGIQCKKKFEKEVTEAELRAEIAKAEKFIPPLNEFILATTAPRDAKIQRVAKEITAGRTDFSVYVWGWDRIEDIAGEHPRVLKAFDPAYNPIIATQIKDLGSQLAELGDDIKATVELLTTDTRVSPEPATDPDESTQRHGKITAINGLIDDGELNLAERMLAALRGKEWDAATESERYRMLVVEANLAIKREKFSDAGPLLISAVKECPTHKNAKKNLAVGYLLTGRPKEAIKELDHVLGAQPEDQNSIDALVQARASLGDSDPTRGISSAQLGSPLILALLANLKRGAGDPTWREAMRKAHQQHPHDKFLSRFAAEAIVDLCISEAPYYLAGEGSESVGASEIEWAATELIGQVTRLMEANGVVEVSLAHNTALACRLVNATDNAIIALRAGLKSNPKDISLIEQVALHELHHGNPSTTIELLESGDRTEGGELALAAAYTEVGRFEDAKALLEPIHPNCADVSSCYQYLGTEFEWFRQQELLDEGLAFFQANVERASDDLLGRLFLAKFYRLRQQKEEHSTTIKDACQMIDANVPFVVVYEFADEAFRDEQYDTVVTLLKDRISFSSENQPLSLCIAAAMNGDMLKIASDLLANVSDSVTRERWFRRTQIALKTRIGDKRALQLLNSFIKDFPNDAEMRLARIAMWQVQGAEGEIRNDIAQTDFGALKGVPGAVMQYYRAAIRYGRASDALSSAYALLLENWDNVDCHTNYQSLFLANDSIEGVQLSPAVIGDDCAFEVSNQQEVRRYRIEARKPAVFGDEWLSPDDDLAITFSNKKAAETVTIQGAGKDRTYTVGVIKSVFLDAFHRSINSFNDRFPSSGAMFQMKIDTGEDDPFTELKDVVRKGAERDLQLLEFYRDNPIPLSWLAGLLGKDEIECAIGIPIEGIKFRTCRGTLPERQQAFKLISDSSPNGVVVDAITAVFIKRLGILNEVIAVTGPLHTPQATIDRLNQRHLEAISMIGRSPGSMGWKDGHYYLTENSDEHLKAVTRNRHEELQWAHDNLTVIPALPKVELEGEARELLNLVGLNALSPVLAAHGSGLPLLIDDFGLRIWAKEKLGVDGFWLQPVLMVARKKGHLSEEKYYQTIVDMVDTGSSYISLDAGCVIYALRTADYDVNKITEIMKTLCGLPGDLNSNLLVAAKAMNMIDNEPCPSLVKYRFASEIARHACYPRWSHASKILGAIVELCETSKNLMRNHLSMWLQYNSMGSS